MNPSSNQLTETPPRDVEKRERDETGIIRHRYDRVAPFYDAMEWFMERRRFAKWREELWGRVEGNTILEVGVGTGKNFPYYPTGRDITALDISPKMLDRARQRARDLSVDVELVEAGSSLRGQLLRYGGDDVRVLFGARPG